MAGPPSSCAFILHDLHPLAGQHWLAGRSNLHIMCGNEGRKMEDLYSRRTGGQVGREGQPVCSYCAEEEVLVWVEEAQGREGLMVVEHHRGRDRREADKPEEGGQVISTDALLLLRPK